MCRILGIYNFNFNRHKEILDCFFNLALTGKIPQGNSPGHMDGWGIGYYKNTKAFIYKSGKSIIKEKNIFYYKLKKIKNSKILIVHLRKSAWPNTNNKENAHPFKLGNLIFAHNGTIFDYNNLLPNKIKNRKILDSQAYFLFAMNNFNAINTFKTAVNYIKKNNKYSSLNCMFSDGRQLFAFREFTKNPSYYSLFHTQNKNSHFICSEALPLDLKWKLLKKNSLLTV